MVACEVAVMSDCSLVAASLYSNRVFPRFLVVLVVLALPLDPLSARDPTSGAEYSILLADKALLLLAFDLLNEIS